MKDSSTSRSEDHPPAAAEQAMALQGLDAELDDLLDLEDAELSDLRRLVDAELSGTRYEGDPWAALFAGNVAKKWRDLDLDLEFARRFELAGRRIARKWRAAGKQEPEAAATLGTIEERVAPTERLDAIEGRVKALEGIEAGRRLGLAAEMFDALFELVDGVEARLQRKLDKAVARLDDMSSWLGTAEAARAEQQQSTAAELAQLRDDVDRLAGDEPDADRPGAGDGGNLEMTRDRADALRLEAARSVLRAFRALASPPVVFSEAQEARIEELAKQGCTTAARRLILAELEKTFAAPGGPKP